MKRKLSNSFLATLLLVFMAFMGTSCKDDTPKINETQWKIINITVLKNSWQWVPNSGAPSQGYYAATVNLPELTPFIYDNGAAIGYYKFDNNTKTALPFLKSYSYTYTANGVTQTGYYTEYISCDFQLGNPSTVTFVIEASDLQSADEFLENKNFQVVLIW